MNAMPNYLDKFGRNFLVASMIPSLAFFMFTMISVQSVLPSWLKDLLGGEFDILGKSGFLLLVLTIVLGFTLTSLNTFIYKVFEGYVLIWRLPFLRESQIKKARKSRRAKENLEKKISKLENKTTFHAISKRNNLIATKNALMAELDLEYPPSEDDILPTRFGNILKSAELYSRSRYQIDGVPMWSRLIHVIPRDYYLKVDQVSNQLSFLMNCAVLAMVYSIITFGISAYFFLESILIKTNSLGLAGAFLVLMMLAILVSIVFLRASVLAVTEFGHLIRSSYDLFRRRLLVELELVPPSTLAKERQLWEDWCDFMNLGYEIGQTKFKFQSRFATNPSQPSPQNNSETDGN